MAKVHFHKFNGTEIFANTPLEAWFRSKKWDVSNPVKRSRFLAEGARFALIFKKGGAYLDTDMISLRDYTSMRNVIAAQDQYQLNAAFMVFERG